MNIVFFLPVILRDEHRQIYPFEQLEREGNSVIILDATKYFKVYHRTATDDFLIKRIVECREKSHFLEFRKSLGNDPVLFVTNELYMKMAAEILDVMVKKQDKLLAASTRIFSGQFEYPKSLRKILLKSISFADGFLPLHFFKFYYKNIEKMYVPDYFLGSTKFLSSAKTILSVKRENRIYIHSDDVNKVYAPLEQIINPQKKIGVFLDQMLPFFNGRNPDVKNNEIAKEYKIEYYKNMVNTLKNIKTLYNLDEVVIALHPEARAIRDEIDKKYFPFSTFVGVTHELIKDAFIVFGHYSTSIGIAVFYKKPIILLKDKKMMSRPIIAKAIQSYVEELGVKTVEIDNFEIKILKEDIEVDLDRYENYVKKFMKEGSFQGNAYHFAINKIKKRILAKQR